MSKYVVVTIEIEVDDAEVFAARARRQAIDEGWGRDEAALQFSAENLGACAQMIFDPGRSPDGCTIESCDAEEHRELGDG